MNLEAVKEILEKNDNKYLDKNKILWIYVEPENKFCHNPKIFDCYFGEYCYMILNCIGRLIALCKREKRNNKCRAIIIIFEKDGGYGLLWQKPKVRPILKKIKSLPKKVNT